MRIPSTQFYSTLTLLTVQTISIKKTSDNYGKTVTNSVLKDF